MSKKKIIVAMSGGVDSSLTAALIKSQGYDTVGITLNLYPGVNKASSFQGENLQGVEYAREVARRLNIPHYLFDVREEFEEKIIDSFCREYLSGRTPNPCIFCNERIKFGTLLAHARRQGADHVATGHYARVVYDETKGRFLLKKGKDLQKDQSYFLFSLSQDQLRSVVFPLGELTKSEVRQKAEDLGLKVSDKPESQEICFIPDNDYVTFLKSRYSELQRTGPIVSTRGDVLGEHNGIFSFTIGQRRGLNIAQGYPLYVISLDKATNTVVVGRKEETYRNELTASRLNWISIGSLKKPVELKARIRYQHREKRARVTPLSEERVRVKFFQPQMAITPGQAVVFYDGDTVIGGGWVD